MTRVTKIYGNLQITKERNFFIKHFQDVLVIRNVTNLYTEKVKKMLKHLKVLLSRVWLE